MSNELKHKIISAMAEHSLSFEDIASKIGVSPTTVGDWTKGANPRIGTRQKLEHYLASLSSGKTPVVPAPTVKVGDWIRVGRIDAYVAFTAKSDRNTLRVAYMQNGSEAMLDVVKWNGERWEFLFDESSGQKMEQPWVIKLLKGPRS